MRLKNSFLVLLGLLISMPIFAFNVTFRVNMSEVVDPFTTPEVNGTFNGFCGGCAQMTNVGGGVWEIVIDLAPGTYEYKFAADSWNIQENLTPGSSCTVTNFGFTNRIVQVVDADVDMGTVCWGGCTDCGVAPTLYDVTFRVDMTDVAEAYTTPEVNGTFNGFCGGCAPMTNVGGDVWELVIALEPGTYEYKFAADAWTIQENLVPGSPCTVTNFGFTNRSLTVVDQNVDQGTVCWASCAACNVAPVFYDVTFRVDMSTVAEAYTTPEVNGIFNGWCGGCAPMTNVGGDVWEITIALEPGTYVYKFAADSWNIQENLTPGDPCTATADGFTNRSLTVVDQNLDLGTVCWASCAPCNVGPVTYPVTFRVDMSNVNDPFTTPEVNGTFNGFCGGCAPMTNVGGDVWEIVIDLEPGTYEYKFAADSWNIQENLVPGSSCTVTNFGFTNRSLTVVNQPVDQGTVCWATCAACENNGGGNCTLNEALTFDDASSLTGWQAAADATNPAEAALGWSVNGVTTGALFMSGSNQANNIGKAYIFQYVDANFDYANATSVTLTFDARLAAPLVGAAFHLQTEFPGVGTTNNFDLQNGGLNENTWTTYSYTFNGVTAGNLFRIHFNIAAGAFVGAGGQVLVDNITLTCAGGGTPTEGCTDADAANYDPSADIDNGSCVYNVTFRVNMAEVAEAYTTPEVNGTFNGFCGGCAPMTNVGGDIWEIVIALAPGVYEYKFAADSWTIQENLVPGSACTVTNFGFTNRSLTVVDAPVNQGTVCWAACADCGIAPVFYDVTFRVDMSNVAEAYTTPEVNGIFNGWCGGCAPMTNIGGDVWEITIALEAGSYQYKFAADSWNIQENLNPADPCTVFDGTFTNRFVNVVDQNVDLGIVCWASCDACPVVSVSGCTYPAADNYDPAATADDGSCIYAGCTDPAANNYNPFANADNGTCDFTAPCPADLNTDGTVNVTDLLAFLGAFGTECN